MKAKRMPPKEVAAVEKDGVRYSAPPSRMGYIEARDIQTGALLWDARLYKVWVIPFLEKDVQDVYINSLTVVGDTLHVTNEKGKSFRVDIPSRKVRTGTPPAPLRETEAIRRAEEFIRHNHSLEPKAYGVVERKTPPEGWTVVFRYKQDYLNRIPGHPNPKQAYENRGRAVTMDPVGAHLQLEHQDFRLTFDGLKKIIY
ncbi:MAG: hypothetical protein LHV69_09640 [Elusimicrobia bacterium]|nr:hypothetical protein [Candidatus Obscuribacterium magneticum]